jgi:hypothetical protein
MRARVPASTMSGKRPIDGQARCDTIGLETVS